MRKDDKWLEYFLSSAARAFATTDRIEIVRAGRRSSSLSRVFLIIFRPDAWQPAVSMFVPEEKPEVEVEKPVKEEEPVVNEDAKSTQPESTDMLSGSHKFMRPSSNQPSINSSAASLPDVADPHMDEGLATNKPPDEATVPSTSSLPADAFAFSAIPNYREKIKFNYSRIQQDEVLSHTVLWMCEFVCAPFSSFSCTHRTHWSAESLSSFRTRALRLAGKQSRK